MSTSVDVKIDNQLHTYQSAHAQTPKLISKPIASTWLLHIPPKLQFGGGIRIVLECKHATYRSALCIPMSGIHHPVDCQIICQTCNDQLTHSSLSVLSFIVIPDWLLHQIKTIINEEWETPSPTPFQFELSDAAAHHNIQVLQSYDNDINACIRAHPNSIINYGSEYRSVSSLHPLLMHHP